MTLRVVVQEEPTEGRVDGRVGQIVALEGRLGKLGAGVFAHLGQRQGVACAQVDVGRGREGGVDLEAVGMDGAHLPDDALAIGILTKLLHDVALLDVESGQLQGQEATDAGVDTGLVLHAAFGGVDLAGGVGRDGAALIVEVDVVVVAYGADGAEGVGDGGVDATSGGEFVDEAHLEGRGVVDKNSGLTLFGHDAVVRLAGCDVAAEHVVAQGEHGREAVGDVDLIEGRQRVVVLDEVDNLRELFV